MSRYKKINLTALCFSVTVLLSALLFWNFVCDVNGCSYGLRNGLLRPLAQAGTNLSLMFGTFLLLPPRYFQSWFKWIFSWAFPFSAIIVLATQDTGAVVSFSKVEMVQLFGAFFGVISVLFVLYHFFQERSAMKA